MGQSWHKKDLEFRKHLSAFGISSLWNLLPANIGRRLLWKWSLVWAARQQEVDLIFQLYALVALRNIFIFAINLTFKLTFTKRYLVNQGSIKCFGKSLLTTITSQVLFVQPVLNVIISLGVSDATDCEKLGLSPSATPVCGSWETSPFVPAHN